MYWNQNSHSSVESLLDKHDTKLETLLSIDNILLQVKNGDKKLISFLSQPDHLMKLFTYAVATNLPEDKAIKYPYVACEIICADNGKFIDAMRNNSNIINPLWDFIRDLKPRHEMSSQINNSITGDSPSAIQNGAVFFSRLNIFLFNKILPNMLNFLDERVPNALDLLVSNLDLQPITELLFRFYALYQPSNDNILDWLGKEKFYEKLADQLVPSKMSDLHVATSQFISGLFSLPFPDSFPRDQVLRPFLDANWLHRLLGNVFKPFEADNNDEDSEEMEESSLISGLEVISSILKAFREYAAIEPKYYIGDNFIAELISNFDAFFQILKRGPTGRLSFLPSIGGNIEVFGRIRLEIVKMFSQLLFSLPYTKNCELYITGFVNVGLIPTLLDAFFYYRQNNILHENVAKIVSEVFKVDDDQVIYFYPIIDQLLSQYGLRQKIVAVQRENDAIVQRPHGNRLQVMGHLTQLAESIIKWEADDKKTITTTTCDFVVSSVPEESWREYCNKTFKETRFKDRKVLGGIKPPVSLHEMVSSSDDDSGDELLNYNAIFRSGDEEQLARYFYQQIIGHLPQQFLYTQDHGTSESDEDVDDDDDDEIEFVFETSYNGKKSNLNIKSIEIPILMQQDNFDEEMFDSSFTSSLLSDDSTEDDKRFRETDESDDDYDSYEM